MSYQSMLIYFTSGTGNTFRVCTWAAEAARQAGVAPRIVPIEAARPEDEVPRGPDGLIGLAMPTLGFAAPWHMLRFALRLPRRQGVHAFVMPSRGAVGIGKRVLPGFEGTAGYLPALILALKGYQLRGVKGIDTPASWTVVHPAQGEGAVDAIEAKSRAQVEHFIGGMLAGGRRFGSRVVLPLALLLAPLSLAYLFWGRLIMAKLMFASERCNGCGVCARDCPVGAIRMLGDPARPYWGLTCESCMRCRNFCPTEAVEASYSLGALLYYLTAMPALATLVGTLTRAALPTRSRSEPAPWHLGLHERRWSTRSSCPSSTWRTGCSRCSTACRWRIASSPTPRRRATTLATGPGVRAPAI